MNLYKTLALPFLKQLDPETTHHQTLAALAVAQQSVAGRAALRLTAGPLPSSPVTLFGLTFPNVLGVAAGFDKDVRVAEGLGLLGFGHVEVGTLTPRAQVGNPRPRIFRLPKDAALINRMGFPNGGVESAVYRLKQLGARPNRPIIGVSLGKQKETPLANATQDYLTVMQQVFPYADYLAVNISSPNTPGLRDLQGGDYLGHLLGTLAKENERLGEESRAGKRPLLVKIAPDVSDSALKGMLDTILSQPVDGIIATNTTIARVGLRGPHRNETGGLSGEPVRARSTDVIATIRQHVGSSFPIIGVGGVRTAAHAQEKLDAGASLVQLYTGMIYEGPTIAGNILRGLNKPTK